MSFSNFARKARDPSLTHRQRLAALRSCVQLYRPLGFHATLDFLNELAGPFQHDERALLAALDAITSSRAARQPELDAYAATRRAAKRDGQRQPRPADPNPNLERRLWHGAPRQGALYALRWWRQRHLASLLVPTDSVADHLHRLVTTCLETDGHLTSQDQELLAACIAELEQRWVPFDVRNSLTVNDRTRGLLMFARYLQTASEVEERNHS
ncbi:hypothetical protein [Longispora urticae]